MTEQEGKIISKVREYLTKEKAYLKDIARWDNRLSISDFQYGNILHLTTHERIGDPLGMSFLQDKYRNELAELLGLNPTKITVYRYNIYIKLP